MLNDELGMMTHQPYLALKGEQSNRFSEVDKKKPGRVSTGLFFSGLFIR